MGLIICDRVIMFFLYLMIFFLPISKAVIEVSASISIFTWFIKQILLLKRKGEFNLRGKFRAFFIQEATLDKCLLLFIIANLLSVIFSSNIKLSLQAFIFKLLEYILLFLIVRSVINSRLRYRIIIWVILCSAIFIGCDGIFQIIAKHDFFRHRGLFQGRATASFINPNDLGSYLITVAPLPLALFYAFHSKKIKSCLIFASLIIISVLILTFSKGAIFSFLPALIFLGLFTQKRYALIVTLVIIFLVLVIPFFLHIPSLGLMARLSTFFSDGGAIDRKFLWMAAARMFLAKPMFGVGLGTFMANYHNFWIKPTVEIAYTHNCYLQTLAETGIFGLLSFISILLIWIRRSLGILSRPAKSFGYLSFLGLTTGLIGYLINSFVDTNLYSLPIAVLFWFTLGLQVSAGSILEKNV